ncbi:hypothetical protein M501DRAFT_926598 [Patellaria atrata CBS 101060]|uniref:N-acetyltransferase domain-containing protein n=1 Tax=Patellaria atrata CBS 101060 TaxID=1346257 RepID=A0A9P4SKK9_9PEZI|nr:hypothetical protein M501DRAFT_926598 [Patellaria atrata CBS 101060]
MSTEFISFQPPPGDVFTHYDRTAPFSSQPSNIPQIFKDAMKVREEVFVKEQHCTLENELDEDDPRSFHWVVYASVGQKSDSPQNTHRDPIATDGNGNNGNGNGAGTQEEERRKSETTATRMPVGVVRLVPPPHPPHPTPGSSHAMDNSEGAPPVADPSNRTSMHDGVEPYIKLGRLATVPVFRGMGLSKLLVNSALDWARDNPEAVLPPPSPAVKEAARLDGKGEEEERWMGLVLVHAQKAVEKVWKRFGFETDEGMGIWYEEGIEHIGMWRRLKVKEI